MKMPTRDSFGDFLADWDRADYQRITKGRDTPAAIGRYELAFIYSLCTLNDLCGNHTDAPKNIKNAWALLRRSLERTETGERLNEFMPDHGLSLEEELTEENFDKHFR